MSYVIRLFSQKDQSISLPQLRACVDEEISLALEEGTEGDCRLVTLYGPKRQRVCQLEWTETELLTEEIAGFQEELKQVKPANGAKWVRNYLASVKTLVACRFFDAAFKEKFNSVPGETMWNIKNLLGEGIIQADLEGFSNNEGSYITWQFSTGVSGKRQAAVLDKRGKWLTFEIDLGDAEQRENFTNGLPAMRKLPQSLLGKLSSIFRSD